ncbi:Gfo/Idh/MocA family oxidoreductase [Halovulum dunhuangense]|uniref:Gfo/Idh/MocA family oxidoreductase n=1 Tax=Halovulum dunhuangense TaxID=1505036 RepID=A0A849L3L3_9RHOB|nr:Gfo/Idh/MocA family oxidoreductase [Halovulum dunhuangense]NNU80946.1 Gfo/Idh/MocA family oxidoreductase [Halovulum dunhuangense]
MTIRYGIIGSGMMGQEHIRNINLLGDARVVAVSDPDAAMRGAAQATAGPGCAAHAHHRDLLAAGGLDALVIGAPNHLHLPILRDAMASGLPILCEKPLGLTDAECAEIEALQAGRRAPLWVAMEYRYMPAITRLIAEVEAGTAGRVHMLSIREHRFPFLSKVGNWNRFADQTGGTLVEKCCHFFDLMRLILKSEPVRVYASGAMDVNFLHEEYGGRKPDIIDNAFVIVDFANRTRAMLDLCMFAEGSWWQEVVSATGDIARVDARIPGPARFNPDGQDRHSQLVVSPRLKQGYRQEDIANDPALARAGDHHGSTFYQHQRFIQMIRTGGAPEVSVRDGRIAVAVGAAAEESIRTGLPVHLPEFAGVPEYA